MSRYDLTEKEWQAIEPHLPNKPRGVPRVDDRRVLSGIFWGFALGCFLAGSSRALWPADDDLQPLQPLAQSRRVGSINGRHDSALRWRRADDRHLHRPCAPAWRHGKKGGRDRCLGRSRGGLTTKIHALVDRQGRPIKFRLTGGEKSDIETAPELIADLPEGALLLADKGYDADALRQAVTDRKAWANIPPKTNRKSPICFSKHLYKARNLIERFFHKIKQFRRIATRYDKLAENYAAALKHVAVRIWIRSL